MLKTIRLPTFKACTLLLVVLFVYDVFFVFITPYFTTWREYYGRSGSWSFRFLHSRKSLLVAYCHRFDIVMHSSRIYFVACTIAYGIGLLITFVALALMKKGQPALLYLVPCTLLTSLALALWRRELPMFWTGSGFVKDVPQPPVMAPINCTQTLKQSTEDPVINCTQTLEQPTEDPVMNCTQSPEQSSEDPVINCTETLEQSTEDPVINCTQTEEQPNEDPVIECTKTLEQPTEDPVINCTQTPEQSNEDPVTSCTQTPEQCTEEPAINSTQALQQPTETSVTNPEPQSAEPSNQSKDPPPPQVAVTPNDEDSKPE
ncbi:hypothetical protein JZ751_024548 [Albula glossodonta]|uniref:Uncharacterized protein n=1 Tax=Albula glossodonta TaxID=121402 RepID=A0A8T2PEM8_9TELE|nr:hypothetical protein JZ751_024548 [Albula glossodonta]